MGGVCGVVIAVIAVSAVVIGLRWRGLYVCAFLSFKDKKVPCSNKRENESGRLDSTDEEVGHEYIHDQE